MGRHFRRRPPRCLASIGAGLLDLLILGTSAQAACYPPEQQLPAQTIAQFKSNPDQLLTEFPEGGAQMISMVRDLVASDPTTLPLILDEPAKANLNQLNAIGTGLGDGDLICVHTDQAFAAEIQQMVAALGNQSLAQAFAAVLGDQAIASVGGGGGGGGIGGGAEAGTGSTSGGGFLGNNSNFFLSTSSFNLGSNYFTSSFATGPSPGTVTTTTSVSPSK